MKIIIKKNKRYAFEMFCIGLKRHSKRKSAQFYFLTIPDEIVKKAGGLLGLEEENYNSEQKTLYLKIKELFDEIWLQKKNQINELLNLLKEQENKIQWISERIPLFTQIKWVYKKIYIFPNVGSWAQNVGEYIAVGITPPHFLEKDFIGVITHELIHTNVPKKSLDKLKYPLDSEEIANTIITNRIIEKVNKDFQGSIRPLILARPFRQYQDEINKISKQWLTKSGFWEIAKAVDKFLISKNHQQIYFKSNTIKI